MKEYTLILNNTATFDVSELKPGDSLTPSCHFVQAHYRKDGELESLELSCDTGSSYGHEDSVETLLLKPGKKDGYVYHDTDITGPSDWEDDDTVYMFL